MYGLRRATDPPDTRKRHGAVLAERYCPGLGLGLGLLGLGLGLDVGLGLDAVVKRVFYSLFPLWYTRVRVQREHYCVPEPRCTFCHCVRVRLEQSLITLAPGTMKCSAGRATTVPTAPAAHCPMKDRMLLTL